jgi:hypothetical protein
MLVTIGTDRKGSYKSNYNAIATTTALLIYLRATPENEGQRPSCISNVNWFLSILLRPFDLFAPKDCLITELCNHLTLNVPYWWRLSREIVRVKLHINRNLMRKLCIIVTLIELSKLKFYLLNRMDNILSVELSCKGNSDKLSNQTELRKRTFVVDMIST